MIYSVAVRNLKFSLVLIPQGEFLSIQFIDQDRLVAAPNCGLDYLTLELATEKLGNMCKAVRSV
jgi:hypothetical protein